MRPIAPPINRNSQGSEVTNLQDNLLLLLRRQFLQVSQEERQFYEEGLLREQQAQRYDDITQKLVGIFQERSGLNTTGEVDAPTAEALNRVLREIGAFSGNSDDLLTEINRKLDSIITETQKIGSLDNQIVQQTVQLVEIGNQVAQQKAGANAPQLNDRGTVAKDLQSNLVRLGFTISQNEQDEQVFGVATRNALLQFQAKQQIAQTGVLDELTQVALNRAIAELDVPTHRVEGRIILEHGLPADAVAVRLYNRGFGGTATLLKEAPTDSQGFYALDYTSNGKAANLEVRVVDAQGQEVSLSEPRLNADKNEVLNLVAPTTVKPLAPEYQRLTNDLGQHLDGLSQLANAEENSDRQDLTLLHQATTWDARLIALAASAVKLSHDTEIPQNALYALFRVGLPTDKDQLAQLDVETVDTAIAKAQEAGIVQLSQEQRDAVKVSFANFARQTRRAAIATGAVSSLGDLLSKTTLTDTEKTVFEDLHATYQSGELWQKAQENGIASEKIQGLQLQGKLAYLTLNSANLAASLQSEIGSPENVAQLVEKDLYQPDAWKARLMALGNDDEALKALIPPVYQVEVNDAPAAALRASLDAYAADLARKVRLSFPTQVVERMIEKDELHLGEQHEALKSPVRTFLQNARSLGFELGQTPVAAFIQENQENPILKDNINPEIVQQIKLLHRLYQITPSNESLKVLASQGFTSAQDVVAFSPDDFLKHYGRLFPSEDEARLVYRKSQQVSSVTFNFFTAAKQLDSAPPMSSVSPPATVREAAKKELIKHYPTMNSLFGSLDFCECEHCRSVLSPAAYLVDLLQFLDPKSDPKSLVWQQFLTAWKTQHGNAPYPFKNPTDYNQFLADWRSKHPGQPDPNTEKTPYEVLIERRPDLPNLPLTCENTNTVLPYIDVVNEILEYYVARGNLAADSVHDTGNATTPELLAEPQNILAEAYTKLQEATYPIGLPFDLWLETVRHFFDHFETPFWQVLELLRSTDELFPPSTNPKPYYRAAILAESLGISPAEYKLFTRFDPSRWYELYGYTTEAEATTALKSAKTLSRQLGISYKELVDLVQTGFLNPRLETLVILHKLNHNLNHNLNLDIDTSDIFRYKEQPGYPAFTPADREGFKTRLQQLSTAYAAAGFNAETWLDTAWNNGDFNQILVLVDPNKGCNFDETILLRTDDRQAYANQEDVYATHKDVYGLILLKLNLFVRLWKKLGWTIAETDRALQKFIPQTALPLTATNLGDAFKTALIYLAHLKTISDRIPVGKDNHLKLLTLWSNLSTTGSNPLYAQLFLTQSVLKNDPVFDDPLGRYLSPEAIQNVAANTKFRVVTGNIQPVDRLNPTAFAGEPAIVEVNYDELRQEQYLTYQGILTDEKKAQLTSVNPSLVLAKLLNLVQIEAQEFGRIKKHLLALQGALNLTADDIERILTHIGQDFATARLSLDAVSLLYRYSLLAKALKLSIRDLIALKQLSGLDPFKPLAVDLLTNLDGDYPLTQTLQFIEIAEKIKQSAFKIEDLDYLLRDRFDPVGKYRPNPEDNLALVKTLATEIRRIQAEHAIPDDPASVSDDVLQQKLALVLPADVVTTFMSMWTGTIEYQASKSSPTALDPGAIADSRIRLSYDATRQIQRLTFRGVLLDDQKTQLTTGQPALFADLLNAVQLQARSFFAKYFTGFLPDTGDFTLLFAPIPDGLTDGEKQKRTREKRAKLVSAFLPFLQQKLIRQFIVQTLANRQNADLALTETLLTSLLSDPIESGQSLLNAFAGIGESGISASFYTLIGGTETLSKTLIMTTADTALTDPNKQPIKPSGTQSVRFEGYFEVPTTGAYRFFVERKTAEIEFRLSHLPDPLLRSKAEDGEISQFTELKAGVLYQFTLDAHNLNNEDVSLLIQGETLPKDSLNQLIRYPQTAVNRLHHAQILFSKTLQLIQGFALSEREIRYFLSHADDFDHLNFNQLPTHADDSPIPATPLFQAFLRLIDYDRLKQILNSNNDLIDIFENARRTFPASLTEDQAKAQLLRDLHQRVANLTRRDLAIVESVAQSLGFTAQATLTDDKWQVIALNFAQEKGIEQLWKVLQTVEKLGIPLTAMKRWTGIINQAKTSDERFAIARDLRNTVKAKYEPETWQRIAQPIFDSLRQKQRDALVAYILPRNGFDRLEQLFEYFLIDPGMEPVVQTSRIRLAISSVQLFIQRCLLNLEPQVNPSAINSQHWSWMKRYRVWEANRKIFLYPENWLEPEFRDDKTHLFQELESALLQGDVSNDLVEDAFFNYLKKLEALARLEIVTMYCEEKLLDPASNSLHVIGRTYSQPHKYFYRRYAHQMWTPWEPVTADIEGDHVVAVMWRERLHLFWVTFMEKGKSNPDGATPPGDPDLAKAKLSQITSAASQAIQKQVEIHLNWSEYFQGQWTTRESSGFGQPMSVEVPLDFQNQEVFIHVTKEYDSGEERAVKVNLYFEKAVHYRDFGAVALGAQFREARTVKVGRFIAPLNQAFRVVSKNSQPIVVAGDSPQLVPYSQSAQITQYKGSGALQTTFVERIENGKSNAPVTKLILQQGGNYFSLLTCSNPLQLMTAEIGSLVSPFFYQDNQNTFFVEPSLTEQTIEQWDDWVISPPKSKPKLIDDNWWKQVKVVASVPAKTPIPDPIDPVAKFKLPTQEDWLTHADTALQFDQALIGGTGRLKQALTVNALANATPALAGIQAADEQRLVVTEHGTELNVIGRSGLNPVVLERVNTSLNSVLNQSLNRLNGGFTNS
ncbi:hypothetical protein BV378_05965 [Nostoc sp. RF31YmG]|nr:hypothetical protein BV378_05965 [Nostoc sp. RF31YmG]